jgi:hypothetical protein
VSFAYAESALGKPQVVRSNVKLLLTAMTPFLSADALLDYDVSEALDGRPTMPQPSGAI